MNEIMEIYDNFTDVGISTRKITEGKEYDLVKKFIDFRKDSFCPADNNNMAIFIESSGNRRAGHP